MGLKDESKAIFLNLLGPEMTQPLDIFEDPERYPKDFLDECTYFLGKLIGDDLARKKFEPLRDKYLGKSARKTGKIIISNEKLSEKPECVKRRFMPIKITGKSRIQHFSFNSPHIGNPQRQAI